MRQGSRLADITKTPRANQQIFFKGAAVVRDLFSLPHQGVFIIAGGYGSGKTEVSVNLATQIARSGVRVRLADLDLVNPYFRCREAAEHMRKCGVELVVPPGEQVYADLPILLPEIAALFSSKPNTVNILDVGGDDVGARVLACLRTRIGANPYEFLQVINACRPFSNTVEGCLKMKAEIETASRLNVTGLIANSHLVEETHGGVIERGWRLACEVSDKAGLPVRFMAVMEHLSHTLDQLEIQAPILELKRLMLPPWLTTVSTSLNKPVPKVGPLMAAR